MTADKNKDGRISFKEVQKLLKLMNLAMNELHANALFTVRKYGMLKIYYYFIKHKKEYFPL